MITQASLRRAIRLIMAGAFSSLLSIPAALAQQAPAAAAADDLDEVVVTGSRIARGSDFESPSPVITLDRDAIEKSGYNNLQQLMERLPINGQGAFSTRGNNQDSTANGAASISLRGLGADATLVLVNGRRVAISSFAENVTTNFVDINSIPVAAIERLEVLKDGSSAIYGSDAVAGVINVILRKDFTGFETSVGYGSTSGSDYDEKSASAVWGTGGENSNVTLIFDYFKNSTLSNTERGSMGTANQSARGGLDLRSSRGFPGRFNVDPDLSVDDDEVVLRDPSCPTGSISPDGTTCRYDFGPWNLLTPEAERTGLLLLAHQGVNEKLEVFTEIAVQHNTSIAQGAPTPLDDTSGLTIPITHPNNPFPNADAIAISAFRTVDAGARQWDISTDNLRGVLGLRGEISDWKWEVAAQRARSKSEQTGDRSQGWVRTDFLQQEINAGRYNPFGGVQNSPEVIDAITTSLVRRGSSNLKMYDAEISGDLFTLPAGIVRMAAGTEYRSESVSDVPDDQFQRGLIFGTEAVSAAGSRNIWAAYVEFAVPVLNNLELSLAGRYDDYSDFGNTTNPKIAVRYTPIENLALRASWGTGFRAPSLAQIGLGPSQESQFFSDRYGCAVNAAYCATTDYNLVFSGNPNLEAEESESINIGAAWRPVELAELTLDYWDITQENKIDEVPFGFLYTQFCNDQNSTVCIRSAPLAGQQLGRLQSINTGFINIGEQSASGIDLGGTWGLNIADSKITLGLTYSYLLEFERVELDAAGVNLVSRSLTGEYEYPEDRAVMFGDWQKGDWGAYANLNYIGSFEDQPDIDGDGTLDYDTNTTRKVGSYATLNLQARYTGFDKVLVSFGIDNVLDEEPPFAIGDGDTDLYGYVQSQYSPRGRFFSGKVVVTF